jgi:hypothetical protein
MYDQLVGVLMRMIKFMTVLIGITSGVIMHIIDRTLATDNVQWMGRFRVDQTVDSYCSNVPMNYMRSNTDRNETYFRRMRMKRRRGKGRYRFYKLLWILSVTVMASKGGTVEMGASKGGPGRISRSN